MYLPSTFNVSGLADKTSNFYPINLKQSHCVIWVLIHSRLLKSYKVANFSPKIDVNSTKQCGLITKPFFFCFFLLGSLFFSQKLLKNHIKLFFPILGALRHPIRLRVRPTIKVSKYVHYIPNVYILNFKTCKGTKLHHQSTLK